MPKFFLHIEQARGRVEDREGGDYCDLDAARDDAIESAREIMSERVRNGEEADGSCFVIVDETGRTMEVVPFESTIAQG